MRVFECLAEYQKHRPVAIVVEADAIEAQFFEALRFYIGYQELYSHRVLREFAEQCYFEFSQPDIYETALYDGVEEYNTCISFSEWAKIRPLFELYVERSNAMHLEASRLYGVDVYGRAVSEIQADITAKEEDYSHNVFQQDFVSV